MSPAVLIPLVALRVYCRDVDLDDALAELPSTYGRALRLRTDGATEVEIATQLDVPLDSVATLIRLAEAKLVTLLARPGHTEVSDIG